VIRRVAVTATTPDKLDRPVGRRDRPVCLRCTRAGHHDTKGSIARIARECAACLHLLRSIPERCRLQRDETCKRMMQPQTQTARGGSARTSRMILRGLIAAFWLGSMVCGAARAQPAAFTDSMGLVPPPGWIAQASDPEQIVLLGPDGLSLIMICLQQGSLTGFFEQLLQPIKLSQADLIPQGPPARGDERVSSTFIISGPGPLSRAFVAARSAPSGRLLIAYGLTQQGREIELARTVLALLDTVPLQAFARREPEARPTAPMSAHSSGQWRADIAPARKMAEQDQVGQATHETSPHR
jgi:hypothetical protein